MFTYIELQIYVIFQMKKPKREGGGGGEAN